MQKVLLCLIPALLCWTCKSSPTTDGSNLNNVPDPAHNSRNSIDWDGTYRGIMPCADCSGIKTELTLMADGSYSLGMLYLDKSENIFSDSGSFIWNEAGSAITLLKEGLTDPSQQYQVGENVLFKLDMEGNRITGELAERYWLHKAEPSEELQERYWKLVELRGKSIDKNEFSNKEVHIILKKEDFRVFGNGGCNTLLGSYEYDSKATSIRFSRMASTLMACPNLDEEQAFKNVLEMADNYAIKNDTLSLHKAKMAPLARFVEVYLR
ncbi:MAG: copper resistance protein NlpE N-terminal domain-containing protein [Cyclobacteriaceae bacterium]|nr:copper resistance protein NlpE N-terminal domain-containing protein [Cyclobacteriaceae bacterium]